MSGVGTPRRLLRCKSAVAGVQRLREDVVPPGALAVRADSDVVFDQHAIECRAGELAALKGSRIAVVPNRRGDFVLTLTFLTSL